MRSLYCSFCEINWPHSPSYERCPNCREHTRPSPNNALPDNEARKMKAHGDLGWWLHENDRV